MLFCKVPDTRPMMLGPSASVCGYSFCSVSRTLCTSWTLSVVFRPSKHADSLGEFALTAVNALIQLEENKCTSALYYSWFHPFSVVSCVCGVFRCNFLAEAKQQAVFSASTNFSWDHTGCCSAKLNSNELHFCCLNIHFVFSYSLSTTNRMTHLDNFTFKMSHCSIF